MDNSNSQDIIFSKIGNIGHIRLNRPKALNALSMDMCKALRNQLKQWQVDDQVKAVIIRGAGDRAFCAGGDIRQLYHNGKPKMKASAEFFHHEYQMNATIFHFDKPYISLLDGITMGGGAGVSMHGSHRVATERLLFAMPETGIGFFPDVGAGFFLTRCPGKVGYYLGLTGDRINAADALQSGLATHVVSSERQADLVQALTEADLSTDAFTRVSQIIDTFVAETDPPQLSNHQRQIADCFAGDSMEDILLRLEEDNSEWSLSVIKTLQSKSPTSLKVTFEQLNRARRMEFDDIMKMEFNIACQFLHTPDFFEGVRAAVIDKDQSPQWRPDRLDKVDKKILDPYFTSAQ